MWPGETAPQLRRVECLSEFPARAVDLNFFWDSFLPFKSDGSSFGLRVSPADLLVSHEPADVSWFEEDFVGEPSSRRFQTMPMSDFAKLFQNATVIADRGCWYLSQTPVWTSKGSASSLSLGPPPLPSALGDRVLDSANLWMNTGRCRSSMHYDAYHNFLVVLSGRKIVQLVSPEHSVLVGLRPVYGGAANHASQNFIDSKLAAVATSVTLVPFQCLFIPEGWWHQVESEPCTIAVVMYCACLSEQC
jgi:hypothetical protein